jgi:hypothetical protein
MSHNTNSLFVPFESLWERIYPAAEALKTAFQEHPVVPPQVSHFIQVPFLTSVKLPQAGQGSPS